MKVMQHRPRKRFGQNFLQDQAIIQQILHCFHPQSTDQVIEIGPGLGALTKPLLSHLAALTVVEIDRDLQAKLPLLPGADNKLTIIGQDALTVDFGQLGKALRIIGNLPYNISTPLILHLLQFHAHIEDMHFMLQQEVVQRIAAAPGNKHYGRLSIMVQYFCEAEALFSVPPEAFFPKPKVDSAIIRLTPYKNAPFEAVDPARLEKIVALAFGMRRKTIANNLKPLLSADALRAIGIEPTLRPEQISIESYVRIAQLITD